MSNTDKTIYGLVQEMIHNDVDINWQIERENYVVS